MQSVDCIEVTDELDDLLCDYNYYRTDSAAQHLAHAVWEQAKKKGII